ncbi:MAG: hypothetical protein LBS06_03980 [Treponema sp.]|jgi:hypothetical protein|nr:hypothetical protein [Treponema sp.]
MKQQIIRNIPAVLTLLAPLAFFACNDPVFYTISQEVRAKDARIKGTPTNIVYFDGFVYVASNALFRYGGSSGSPQWTSILPPEGKKINHLAATKNYLYMLCSSDSGAGSTSLYRLGPAPLAGWDWEPVGHGEPAESGYPSLFSIHADSAQESERLFVGAWNGNGESSSLANYAIFWVDETTNSLKLLVKEVGALSGAAWNGSAYFHFLSTGTGIYATTEPPFTASVVSNSADIIFPGIIQLKPGGQTVAVDREGYIYTVTAAGISYAITLSGTKSERARIGYRATGALATYKRPGVSDTELLLVGIQGDSGSSNYGYREINLVSGDLPASIISYFPGSSGPSGSSRISSITDGNSSRYESTLGDRPVYYLYQTPENVDDLMTLFAATATDGLFSYREREEGWHWNAEE